MARVVIEQLTKIFAGAKRENIRAVDDASLTVESGEFMVLVGPSGCGKTTTLRMIAGLEEVTSGTIAIDGRELNRVAPKDRDIAMVFQNHALYPHMTVYENLAFGLKLRKLTRAEIDERVREAADMLGLAGCLERLPDALSGGERQRVSVGRAIVRKPKVFLFDEPLSNLDLQMRVQMRREISKLHDQLGTTMIYVTHDQVEAMTMGDRIAVMKSGVIQQVAEPMQLYREPANMFVGRFIGSPAMNFFRGTIVQDGREARFETEDGKENGFSVEVSGETAAKLTAHSGKKIVLGIRPEDISDKPVALGQTVEAAIELVEPMGPEIFLHAKKGAHDFAVRLPASWQANGKQTISLAFDLPKAHFFDAATEKMITG